MDKPIRGWLRHPSILGLISGFLVGMLWWVCLMIAFGLSAAVTNQNGQSVERPISLAGLLVYAPLVAVPWAIVGMIVGTVSNFVRGYWVPALAALGTMYSLATNPFDGWLALNMPINCLVGALVGILIGVVCAAVQILVASSHEGMPAK